MKLLAFLNPALKLTEDEKAVKEVVEMMVNHQDTKFQMAPLSKDVILLNRPKEFFILVNSGKIKITNHNFSLEKSFRISFVEEIKDSIFAKMETDRQDLIQEIFKNEMQLFSKIKNKLEL